MTPRRAKSSGRSATTRARRGTSGLVESRVSPTGRRKAKEGGAHTFPRASDPRTRRRKRVRGSSGVWEAPQSGPSPLPGDLFEILAEARRRAPGIVVLALPSYQELKPHLRCSAGSQNLSNGPVPPSVSLGALEGGTLVRAGGPRLVICFPSADLFGLCAASGVACLPHQFAEDS